MRTLFILSLCLMAVSLSAQQKSISGTLTDSSGKAVAHVTVILKDPKGNTLGFANSGTDGKYRILTERLRSLDSCYLEINSLNYVSSRHEVKPGSTTYDFRVKEKVVALPEVKVKARPFIRANGDTLSYDVSSFARDEDRSIGDVLKRLPGITIDEGGKISYNGKPIYNLFIHGDDLMDGRYGLATKVISRDMIKSVDIVQNFQPVRVLKNKVPADDVMVNLVLKDENSLKLAGQAMLGAGLPGQLDLALNLMLFNKRFKMLNSLKTNNAGIDYRSDFSRLGTVSLSGNGGNSQPDNLLSAGTAGNPDLPRSNYYFNRSGIINLNNLLNGKNGTQWKANIQGFLDRSTFTYRSRVENYLSGDTIRYQESQEAVSHPYVLNNSFTVTSNRDKYYFSDNLQVNFSGDRTLGYMDLNGLSFNERLRNRGTDISNEISWMPLVRNGGIMQFNWYANRYTQPQQLMIDAGLNPEVLNEGEEYLGIRQDASIPGWFSHLSASYRSIEHSIRQSYQVGLINERQELNSTLALFQTDGSVTDYAMDAGNALHWARDRAYLSPSFDIVRPKWEAGLSVPLMVQSIRYRQEDYSLKSGQTRLFVNPKASLRLFLNSEDYLKFSYSYGNSVGNIAGVYRGAVLRNYRTLTANDAGLQEQTDGGTGVYFNFQRSIILLFINAGINYNKVKANSILSSLLTDNVQRTVLLPYENDQSRLSANAGISKYLFRWKMTVSAKAFFSRSRFEQFVNDERLPYNNDSWVLNGNIETKLFNHLSLSYYASYSTSTGRLRLKDPSSVTPKSRVMRIDQRTEIGYSFFKSVFLNLRGRYSYSDQTELSAVKYFFLDAGLRLKLVKWRTDLEFDLSNIVDVRNYEIYRLSSNQLTSSLYQIRGRTAMVRATFNL